MKTNTKRTITIAALGLAACLQPAQAQLVIPSDGSDGAFAPTTNIVIDLSQAVTGAWDAANTANAGKGIYDPNKWAVVFKYSSVNIPAGATVSFLNHPTHAPVVWLVQGGVANQGSINLNGAEGAPNGVLSLTPAEPGPGGFRGGPEGPEGYGYGLGPEGRGGAWGGAYLSSYGNPQIVPLVGGSGGAGYGNAGGGGAILIAASGTVQINGSIYAKGGSGSSAGGGSGGAVRIIAAQVQGSGEVNCFGGSGYNPSEAGRIRIESPVLAASLRTYPETIAAPPSNPPAIWPPGSMPSVKILSVDTIAPPADPTAPLTSSSDVAIYNNDAAVVVLETSNFQIEGVVQVRVAQKWGAATWVTATYDKGNQASATWRASITFVKGYTTLQARATAP